MIQQTNSTICNTCPCRQSTLQLTVIPAEPTALVVVVQPASRQVAGAALAPPPAVRAVDAFGNPVDAGRRGGITLPPPALNGTVMAALVPASGFASAPTSSLLQLGCAGGGIVTAVAGGCVNSLPMDADGVYAFSSLSVLGAAAGLVLRFMFVPATAAAGNLTFAQTSTFTTVIGSPAALVVIAAPFTFRAGVALATPVPFAVAVHDAGGNGIPGTSGGGSVAALLILANGSALPLATRTTGLDGIANFSGVVAPQNPAAGVRVRFCLCPASVCPPAALVASITAPSDLSLSIDTAPFDISGPPTNLLVLYGQGPSFPATPPAGAIPTLTGGVPVEFQVSLIDAGGRLVTGLVRISPSPPPTPCPNQEIRDAHHLR